MLQNGALWGIWWIVVFAIWVYATDATMKNLATAKHNAPAYSGDAQFIQANVMP